MKHALMALLLAMLAPYVLAAQPCSSFRDPKGRSAVDFAPPDGYIDVCSRDAQMCTLLTKGYPPSLQTVGYFALAVEWQRYQKKERVDFTRYLIAQRGRLMSPQEFADFKRYVHTQKGNIQDHTDLPPLFESQGRVPLGVTEETDDSISSGVIMKLATLGAGAAGTFSMASINIVLQLKGETLSLYAFDTIRQASEAERVKALAKDWLDCIRARNPR